jgi:hypothetical protein
VQSLEILEVEHHFPEYFPIDPEESPLGKQSAPSLFGRVDVGETWKMSLSEN